MTEYNKLFLKTGTTSLQRSITNKAMRLLQQARAICRHHDFKDIVCGTYRYLSKHCIPEKGIMVAHERLTSPGDQIVIVGGGDGVTAITAGSITRTEGSVTIYEAGDRACREIAERIQSDRLSSICTVHHALVGPHIDVYGGDTTSASRIHPRDLPSCDVLELDCEGAEVAILRDLRMRPRVIIVEIHPIHFTEDAFWVLDRLDDLGYEIVYRSGHDGIEIDDAELRKLLSGSKHCGIMLKNGARSPGVVAALRMDERPEKKESSGSLYAGTL